MRAKNGNNMAKETKHKGKDSGREEKHAKERKTINKMESEEVMETKGSGMNGRKEKTHRTEET